MITKKEQDQIAQILLEEDAHMQLIERIAKQIKQKDKKLNIREFIRKSTIGETQEQ